MKLWWQNTRDFWIIAGILLVIFGSMWLAFH